MSWLVANTLVAALVALLALALGRARLAPAAMHALWLFVVLKLATPPLFAVPIDFGAAPAPVAAPIELASDDPRAVALRTALFAADPAPISAPISLAAASEPRASEPLASGPSWRTFALTIWAIGSACFTAWIAIGLWRGHRRLRALQPVTRTLEAEVSVLAAQLAVRAPQLLCDPDASAPYVWSFGRTRLVLPVAALAAATPKGRAAVLAHELAHLRRRDHWLAHVELLLMVLLWWHPLFWFARARMRLWSELACDAWAIASVPDAQLDYATVLVHAVALPDSAAPAPAVLAARPAARAAFERRLQMILNENVPCRASRAWWLPLSSLALGLFAVPVTAQNRQKEPTKVEIRINGKQVDELSPAERTALLRKLLHAEEPTPEAAVDPAGATAEEPPMPRPKVRSRKVRAVDPTAQKPIVDDIQGQMRSAMAEARAEIANDEDLRELGIQDDVVRLLDDLGDGKGVGDSLPGLVKAALRGAGKLAAKEIAADQDLREMGIGDGLAKLVQGMLGDERMQDKLIDLVSYATEHALREAKAEIADDADLQRLGIAGDVQGLVSGVLEGSGDLDASLQSLIHKAMQAAMREAEAAPIGESASGDDEQPAAKPRKQKGKKKVRVELR